MINTILTKVFGSQHEREVKKLLPIVAAINEMEPQIKALSDDELRARTAEFKAQLAAGASTDDLLIPAFAVAREGAWRAVHMRPFDVQLMGGMVLHRGRIAEMKTGEGKTLVATLPVYLNALDGQGRPRRHGQRLPRPPRRGLDGPDLPVPGPLRRRHPARHAGRGPQARVRLRHHLRHQQRVRLRLPARQHEVRAGIDGPARPPLRDRRRGGLDPHRRGPHAADHLRPLRGVGRTSTTASTASSPSLVKGEEVDDGRRQEEHDRRLRGGREGAPGESSPTRASRRSSSSSASATSTSWRTWRSSTASTRRCAPTRSTSATSST